MLLGFRLWVNAHFDKKAIDVKRAAQTLDNKATDWREMHLFALTGSCLWLKSRERYYIIFHYLNIHDHLQNSSGCDPTLDYETHYIINILVLLTLSLHCHIDK